ncbi:MAG: signal peptidase II [Anaerolineales bacterium]|nr:signal peptidase II [Anaerolineales bacterium]
MEKYGKDYLGLLALAGGIITLDQLTKHLVRANMAFNEIWSPWDWLTPYARIVHWKNTGAAFGMLQDFSIVFTVLSTLVSLAIIYYYPQIPRRDWPLRLAMGMQLGGAVGNLIDRLYHSFGVESTGNLIERLRQGYVTDFISVGDFPVFNVADACISMSVVVLLLGLWYQGRQQKRLAAQKAGEGAVLGVLEEYTETSAGTMGEGRVETQPVAEEK